MRPFLLAMLGALPFAAWPAEARAQAASTPASQPAPDEAPLPDAPDNGGGSASLFRGPWLKLDELTFDLGFDAEWHRRQTRSDARGLTPYSYRITDSFQKLEESVGARGAGYLLDERFATFQFDARWGLSQERFTESRPGPDLDEDPHGSLWEYDARIQLFPAGKMTANAFALKADDRLPRPFLPSLERDRERYGVEVLFNDRVLPMRLTFEDSDEILTSYSRELRDDEQNSERSLRYEAAWQPSEQQRLALSYEYVDERRRYGGSRKRFDTTRHDLNVNHVVAFGEDNRSRLETLMRFEDESGDLARDAYEISPQLRLQHTDRLASTYKAQWLRQSYEGSMTDLMRGDVGLIHQLDDWLTSSATLYALRQDLDLGSDTSEWGAVLTSSPSRKNKLGRFSANISYAHSQYRADSDRSDGIVLNEAVTFRDPLPAYLAHIDVLPLSILVTDPGRSRVFIAGQDYLVTTLGRYTALARVRNGNIADGDSVLVSYRYRTQEGLEIGRDRVDLRVQQDLPGGFTPYYAASVQFESADRQRFLAYEPRDINRHRVGVNYQRKRGSAGIEYEYNDDSIDPYNGMHFNGNLTVFDKPPHTVDLNAALSHLRFDGAEGIRAREATLFDTGLAYRCLLGRDLEGNLAARYRFEDDSIDGRTNGVDVSTSLNWRIGLFTASVEVEYDMLDIPGSEDGTFVAWVKLRREIPLIQRAVR